MVLLMLLLTMLLQTSNLKKFFKKFEDYKLSTWKEVMSVNIDSFFLVSKYAGQYMVKK